MNVEHAPVVVLDEAWRQDPHEARKHDQIGLEAVNDMCQGRIERFAPVEVTVIHHGSRDALRAGVLETRRIGAVADDGGDARDQK